MDKCLLTIMYIICCVLQATNLVNKNQIENTLGFS